jgi:hypothetical protein
MYKTKDFYLACSLMSNGIKLVDSEKDGGLNSVFFIFNTQDQEDFKNSIIDDFINQRCYVNVKKFTYAMKQLRKELDKYNR